MRVPRLTRLVLVAAAVSAVVGASTPAHAARGMEVALQDDAIFLNHWYYSSTRAFQQAQQLQVTRLRVNLLWAKALPTQRALKKRPRHLSYDFRPWVSLSLAGQPLPAFASGHHRQDEYKPNARRFAEFARDVARHFRGRVDRYSIWNEPNHKAWLAPVRSQGRIYRKLYVAGYRAIKRVNRHAKVFIGETAPFSKSSKIATPPLKFLRQVTCANRHYHRRRHCRALVADGYAHHPYEFTRSPKHPPRQFNHRDDVPIAHLGRLTRALDKLRRAHLLYGPHRRRLDLYLHEYGYFNSGRGKVFPQATRAKFLVGGFTIAQRNRRVRTMLQYGFAQPPPSTPGAFFDLSIVSRGGSFLQPFVALRAWASIKRNRGPLHLPPRKR